VVRLGSDALRAWCGSVASGLVAGWTNWGGNQRCSPAAIEEPASEAEVCDAVRRARSAGRVVRVAGSGHSFSDVVPTDGVLLRLGALNRVVRVDGDLATVQAGMTLHELGAALAERGLALENQGDIDAQTVAGALVTGTHGTGARFRNLAANVVGMRLVDGRGEARAPEGDDLRAARVSVGALGAITEVTLRCVPLFAVHRVDEIRPLRETLDALDHLVETHDHLELFVFPYTDVAIVRASTREAPGAATTPSWRAHLQEDVVENAVLGAACRLGRRVPRAIPSINRTLMRAMSRSEKRDLAHRVYATRRAVRFTESEYAVPREHGRDLAERVLDGIRTRGIRTGFPIEVRFVAGDDAFLSPAGGRDTCYVAVHQFEGMYDQTLFDLLEGLADRHGGRPHWGKRHTQTAATLAPRYPRWADFQAARDGLDPDRVFTSAAIARVLGA
jgi:L-gulono-1,4-lactone dehydrogenase